MIKPKTELAAIKYAMRDARAYILAHMDGRIKLHKSSSIPNQLTTGIAYVKDVEKERKKAIALLVDLVTAATDDVNEKGGSGNLLGRLSDAKNFLAERTKVIRYD